jgi:hypothetical protein
VKKTVRWFRRPALESSRCCLACLHFDDDPVRFEAAIKGLACMGSAHASVRGRDGICLQHDRFCSATWACPEFMAKLAFRSDPAEPPTTKIA